MTRTELQQAEEEFRKAIRDKDTEALAQWAYSHGAHLTQTLESMIESYDMMTTRGANTTWGGFAKGCFTTTIAQTE